MALILRRPVHSVQSTIPDTVSGYSVQVDKKKKKTCNTTPYTLNVSQHHPSLYLFTFTFTFTLLHTPYSILLQYSHRQHMDHTHTPAKTTRSTSYNNIPSSSYIVLVQSTGYTQGNSYPMVPLRSSQGSQLVLANHRTEAGRHGCLDNIYGRSP